MLNFANILTMSRIAAIPLIVGFLLLNGAFWHWVALALFVLAIPALWPFYQEGLPRSFDGGLHLLRLGVLDELIRQGTLYPRWAPGLFLRQPAIS